MGDIRTRLTSTGLAVITADMILHGDGRLRHTRTCWTCRHRIHYTPGQIAKMPTRPYEHCQDGCVTDWHRVPMCERNPIAVCLHGAIRQYCGLWELDGRAWHSIEEEVYEHEWRVRCERAPAREVRHAMRPMDQGGLGLREVLEYMGIPTGCEQSSLDDYVKGESS